MARGGEKTKRPVLLKVLRGNAPSIPTARDWEERRARQRVPSPPKDAPIEPLADISWLSMVCFVEAIDPHTLALSEELTREVRQDLETLEGHDTLEMYWSCLDRLRRLGVSERQGESDASDSE